MRTIKGKLAMGVGAFLTLLSIVAAQAVYGISITSSAMRYLARTALPQAALYEQFDLQLSLALPELSEALSGGPATRLDSARQHIDKARAALAAIEQPTAAAQDPLLLRLAPLRRELLARVERLYAARAGARDSHEELEQIEAELERQIEARHAGLAQVVAASAAEAEAPVQAALIAAPLGFSAIGLMAICMAWLLHRAIVRPVRELSLAAAAIGEGQLDQPIVTGRRDEIGTLQRALGQTAANLREREQAIAARTAQVLAHQRAELSLIQARDSAVAANRAKSAFLSMMSHELRTPLTAIIGYSQLIEQLAAAGDYRRVVPDIQHIYAAGQHLLTVINDVLEFSQVEAGRLQLSADYLNVLSLVHDVAARVEPLLEQNGSALHIECPDQVALMYTDAAKVHQSLLNLVNNAAKFTESGTITLTVSQEEVAGNTWISFRVADDGIGIAADQLHKLFQPFSQVDDSENRKYGGSGLSLALSQRICQMLGGEISVQSELGVGSVFTLRLPASLEHAPPLDTAAVGSD